MRKLEIGEEVIGSYYGKGVVRHTSPLSNMRYKINFPISGVTLWYTVEGKPSVAGATDKIRPIEESYTISSVPPIECGMICETEDGGFYINFPKEDKGTYWIDRRGRHMGNPHLIRLYKIKANYNYSIFFTPTDNIKRYVSLIWEKESEYLKKENLAIYLKDEVIDFLPDETLDKILKDIEEMGTNA